MVESFGYVMQSLMLAVVLIYAILASQFRSFAAAVRHHALAAAVAGGRGRHAVPGEGHAEHDVHDRA